MPQYVVGFVFPVPRKNMRVYRMKDPRIAKMMKKGEEPFDMKRMAYGGFRTVVQL
jgi:uncharacterized protein YbaA (DUF1428 family)